MNTDEVIFQIIHTENIGMIGVVFTPFKVWEKTQHLSLLRKYHEFKDIFEELELIQIFPSVFEHNGVMTNVELEHSLLEKGFKKNNTFSLYIDIEFSCTGLSNSEIIKILNKHN